MQERTRRLARDQRVHREKNEKGEFARTVERVEADTQNSAGIASVFFDAWRSSHPHAELERVPADMVTASGSGPDPHITLDNANYQLDRVAAWAKQLNRDKLAVRTKIEEIIKDSVSAPLQGLAGTKLIHVTKVNLAMQSTFCR